MSVIKPNRPPGLTFLVPCHNEEMYIGKCIMALKGLKVPHEIIVILHRCTDGSKAIVEGLQKEGYPIRIIERELQVSRAGYQTLVTPVDHPLSFVSYFNSFLSQAKYNWIVLYGGDAWATPEFIDYLNNLDLDERKPIGIRLGAQLGENGVVNSEVYLSNAIIAFRKHIFWEVSAYAPGYEERALDKVMIKSISSDIIKPYWSDLPWFFKIGSYDAELASKYAKLTEICGPEPKALARASNKDFDQFWPRIIGNEELLKQNGIYFYQ